MRHAAHFAPYNIPNQEKYSSPTLRIVESCSVTTPQGDALNGNRRREWTKYTPTASAPRARTENTSPQPALPAAHTPRRSGRCPHTENTPRGREQAPSATLQPATTTAPWCKTHHPARCQSRTRPSETLQPQSLFESLRFWCQQPLPPQVARQVGGHASTQTRSPLRAAPPAPQAAA